MDADDAADLHFRTHGVTDEDIENAGGDPKIDHGPRYIQGLIRVGGPPQPPINIERGDRPSQPIELDNTQSSHPPNNPTQPLAPVATAPTTTQAAATSLTYVERAQKAAAEWKSVTKKSRPTKVTTTL